MAPNKASAVTEEKKVRNVSSVDEEVKPEKEKGQKRKSRDKDSAAGDSDSDDSFDLDDYLARAQERRTEMAKWLQESAATSARIATLGEEVK